MQSDSRFYSTSGNRFIILNCPFRKFGESEQQRLVQMLIEHEQDSGLLIEHAQEELWNMRVIEKDGSESSFCGNGAVAVSKYLYDILRTERALLRNPVGTCNLRYFPETNSGSLQINASHVLCEEGVYRVLGEPHVILERPTEEIHEYAGRFRDVNVSCIERFDLNDGKNRYRIRTYERGVNAVTRSCGSACFSAFFHLRKKDPNLLSAEFHCPGGINSLKARRAVYEMSAVVATK